MLRRLFTLASALCLLLLFATVVLWVQSYHTTTPPTSPAARVQAVLARPFPPLAFDGAGFSDTIDFVSDVSGLKIIVDWPALHRAGINRDTPITMKVAGARGGEVLRMTLAAAAGAEFRSEGNVILSTARGQPNSLPAAGAAGSGWKDGGSREWVAGQTRWRLVPYRGVVRVWHMPADPAAPYQSPSRDSGATAPDGDRVVSLLGFSVARGGWPFNSWALTLPLWMVACVMLASPALWAVAALRRRRRLRANLCARCGYDLRASPDRCPECGTPVHISATAE